jgi:benzoyl-CoA reductase subunit D
MTKLTAGIDVGSSTVKAVIMRVENGGADILAHAQARIRKRIISEVVNEVFETAAAQAGVTRLDYIASTGDGEEIPIATGHFYGMTTHARGALFLEPRARAVFDVGALHARAVAMDGRGKVLNYKMTSQCASGSGQFLENIARYLGVSQGELGQLSLQGKTPEAVSSICAVLAETDVINMVSRGISTPDILRGIHNSMADRYARLLQAAGANGGVFISGGLAADDGLLGAMNEALAKESARRGATPPALERHELSAHAGAIGAALWGAYRHGKLNLEGDAWTEQTIH